MVLVVRLLCTLLASVSRASVSNADTLTIGYLDLAGDPRYREQQVDARLPGQPWGRPFAGAQLAVEESRFAATTLRVQLELVRKTASDLDDLARSLDQFITKGVGLVLLDVPGPALAELAEGTVGRPLLLFNVSASEDVLREERCQTHLLHVAPSQAMLMDALAQYLVARNWRRALVLEGPSPADHLLKEAFARAAGRFGLRISETRPFVRGQDPRQRALNNVALLTAGADDDVVFVADAVGDFAREVPYQTQQPRPVVGGAGLVPDSWHWAWERHGGPQLNRRFQRQAQRPMTGYDWSAWLAVKAIVEAVVRTGSTDFQTLSDFIVADAMVVDGFKGYRLNFRPWNGQLRQPIFLTTGDWVVARAPIEGFLHEKNNLDTLGYDANESRCRSPRSEPSKVP